MIKLIYFSANILFRKYRVNILDSEFASCVIRKAFIIILLPRYNLSDLIDGMRYPNGEVVYKINWEM